MMLECCLTSCEQRGPVDGYGNKVSYHALPRNSCRRKLWLAALGKKQPSNWTKARICSRHFRDQDFVPTVQHGRRLLPTAVPQVCLHNEHDGTVKWYTGETASPSSSREVAEPKDEVEALCCKDEEIARLKDQLQVSDMIIENLQQQICRLERKCFELEVTSKKFCLETLKTLEKWCELV
ncbi:uncharacterized protein LOC142585008 isoform X1 [Dermacentor variabilis]|uniref:uncharacterized protein LOC142585008 isoform X1 n=1 Tax=Dermacentor variabilis TaxID=34621 RepID=UPI003F5C1575